MKKIDYILVSLGVLLVLSGSGVFAILKYMSSPNRGVPMVYANSALLLETWNEYKNDAIEASSHRTIDKTQNNITTSEGESYTMLRAVWMDDKTTFDQSWQFTQDNMQRSDHLMSWKFGLRSDGTYGVLNTQGGMNTASDADGDIALSLLMAYSRWNEPSYLYQAKQIINSIWTEEVVSVQGQPVLAADDLERYNKTSIVVNPSYFAPYSYKLFAIVDKTHDWTALVNNSYTLLGKLSTDPLGSTTSDGLPPDWITINRQTGAFTPDAASNLDTNYSYDAIRVPFRLALDYEWFKDPRDEQLLQGYSFLKQQFQKNGKLDATYAHDGTVPSGDSYESPAVYGASLGYFKVVDPADEKAYYQKKLVTLYSPDLQEWKTPLSYYDDNWAWFGIALAQDALPNLAETNQ